MNAYYFRHHGLDITLSAVYAITRDEAEAKLVEQHSWAKASTANCSLLKVVAGTEWDRQLSDTERIKKNFL